MTKRLWAGLDVGDNSTSVCVIDDSGQTVHSASCPSEVRCVHRELACLRRRRFTKIGIEAATGMHLARGLRSLGYDVDLYEQRQLSKFLRLRRNKTDAGDAIGIADAARIGASTVSKVHLKTLECQSLQSILVIRRHLIQQRVASGNVIARQLRLFGGAVQGRSFAAFSHDVEAEIRRVFGKTENNFTQELRHLVDHWEQLFAYQRTTNAKLKRAAANNDVCRRFMQIPGVGPICALNFYAVVGDPFRFSRNADIGSYLGLTPRISQSGTTLRVGRISKMGNSAARSLLVGASMKFIRAKGEQSSLQRWALQVESRRGRRKACVALARKLATVMLAMWKSGEPYKPEYQ